ncbi:MAG: TetR/AcrR family transcriptional regulator [Flavobacteriales bacterium]|nr:TetR/AcrR family transcriptional regulator [Flavobacteriales bacterium]
MISKAQQTADFIVQTVAPIFNKNGYYGTSMSDITAATGLTKGAIYGNFKNKEELAFIAFKYNVDRVVNRIKEELSKIDSPLQQLYGLLDFYREYNEYTLDYGGCPILNIGVDANHQNPELLTRVQQVVEKLQFYIAKMISLGIEAGEIKAVNPNDYARRIFCLIEGAVFMACTMEDNNYISEMMDHAERIVRSELER